MSIKTTTNRIEEYKAVYLEGMGKLNAAYGSEDLTDEGRQKKVAEIKARYTPVVEAAAERVLAEIENTKKELRADRQAALAKGLENAEAVSLVKKGIESGDYSADMIADLIEAYKGEPIMSEAIRGAVKGSDDAEIVALAKVIPEDLTLKQIKGLDKAAERIKAAPKFEQGMSGDTSVFFWQNGTSIDNLVTFLLGLEDFEQAEEQAPVVIDEDIANLLVNGQAGVVFGNEGVPPKYKG